MRSNLVAACAALTCALWTALPASAAGLDNLQLFSDAFAELTSRVKPAVVAVNTEKEVTVGANNQLRGTPFEDFFRNHPRFRMPEGSDRDLQTGLGSGVIVSRDGYILTNNHVITNGRRGDDAVADRITVELSDLRTFEATVVGRDPNTDLAVLKIEDGDDLPYLPFGKAEDVDVGEWVLAIGNPFGQLHTVTTGIVSALDRGAGLTNYEDYIQTDAAINPGNSGGALVNMAGELIGINTAIVSRSGGYDGIGYAIPVDLADNIMKQLIAHGEVRRGLLGIGIDEVSADLADALGLDSRKGVLVTSVMEDLPAAAAGLKTYDVIREVDGRPTDTPAALRNQIAHTPPGTKVRLTVLRDGKQKRFTVELASLDEANLAQAEETPREVENLGMAVQALSDELAERLGLEDPQGVVVSRVERGSAAARAGIQPRDLIVEIDKKKIRSVGDYEEAIEAAQGTALVMIQRATRRGLRTDILALRIPE